MVFFYSTGECSLSTENSEDIPCWPRLLPLISGARDSGNPFAKDLFFKNAVKDTRTRAGGKRRKKTEEVVVWGCVLGLGLRARYLFCGKKAR